MVSDNFLDPVIAVLAGCSDLKTLVSYPSEFPGGLAYHRDSRNQSYGGEES